MKDGHIVAVQFLTKPNDAECIAEARQVFVTKGLDYRADGFEVWDGDRFANRFPESPKP